MITFKPPERINFAAVNFSQKNIMELTQWIFGNTIILEPMTALTDFIVTAVCIFGFFKLKALAKKNGNNKSFVYFFLFMGLGTFFAALMTHAFSYAFTPEQLSKSEIALLEWSDKLKVNLHNMPNWIFNVISVTLFEIGIIKQSKKHLEYLNTKFYFSIIIIESVLIFAATLYILKYDIAAAHIGFALYLIELPLQIIIIKKNNAKEAKFLIIGTLLMLITAPVMALKLQITKWFNFNDISHVVIAITMYLFFLAGKEFYKEKTVQLKIEN